MAHKASIMTGVALATLLSGPIFLTSCAAAWLYLQLPHPILIPPDYVAAFVGACVLSALGGCIVAWLPNLLGSSLLTAVGDVYPEARSPVLWAAVGALAGAGIAMATHAFHSPPAAFGLVATSAACAWICRRGIVWD